MMKDNEVVHTVTKSFRDFPAAHRQHNHDGHCRLVHGHDWGFDIVFGCALLDENNFVLDVGKLKSVKEVLEKMFDHTLLINKDDPFLDFFVKMEQDGYCSLRVVDSCGMEGLAEYVFHLVQKVIEAPNQPLARSCTHRRLRVLEVTCWEDSKNRATYRPQ